MRKPPPKKKGEANLQSILSTLPSKAQAAKAIATVYILTKYSEDEVTRINWSITFSYLCRMIFINGFYPTYQA
jgi:hypothetical protein